MAKSVFNPDNPELAPLYVAGKPFYRRCAYSQCGKKFEVLSSQWKYKTVRNGKELYFCRYNHWMADERENGKKPALRGEKFCVTCDERDRSRAALNRYLLEKQAVVAHKQKGESV